MKATMIKYHHDHYNKTTATATRSLAETGILMTRTQSRAASLHKSLYSNRPSSIRCTVCKVGAVDMVDAVGVVYAAEG